MSIPWIMLAKEGFKSLLRRSGRLHSTPLVSSISEERALFYGDLPNYRRYACLDQNVSEDWSGQCLPQASAERRLLKYKVRDDMRLQEYVQNLVYTPDGMARVAGAIDLSFSSYRKPGAGRVFRALVSQRGDLIPRGTVIEREYPNTYGDYYSEDLKPLVLSGTIVEPVIFPRSFAARPYLHNDMRRLGLSYRFADRTLQIEDALVLRKSQHLNTWSRAEVEEYRSRLGLPDALPEHGSLIYLSRKNVLSRREKAAGVIDSDRVERIVQRLGGKVVDTESMGYDEFKVLSSEAETVIADHGAALFNMLLWGPRQVIELVPEDWWSPCFVILSSHLGVIRHTLVNVGDYDDEKLSAKLSTLLQDLPRRMG